MATDYPRVHFLESSGWWYSYRIYRMMATSGKDRWLNIASNGQALTTLVCFGNTNPIPDNSYLPWSRPCRVLPSNHDVTGRNSHSSSLSMSELTGSVHILTAEALGLAQTLRDEIFQHRLNSNLRMANYFDTLNHNNFPMRQDVIQWTHTEHTGDVLRRHYRHVSFLVAFLELTKESSTSTDGVLQHVNNLEEKLYELLCHMMTTLQSLNLSVESHVTRDEIPEQLSEITSLAVINSRDFIIAKDAVHLLSALKESHSLMRTGYQ